MFGLDPLSRLVAIAEMLLLLSLAAFVGWLMARLLLNSRVNALQMQINGKEAELDRCRRAKVAGPKPAPESTPPDVVPTTQVVEPLVVPVVVPAMAAPALEVPVMVPVETSAPPAPEPVVVPVPTPMSSTPVAGSEEAVLQRIASRADEINFDRIGRATPAEADDLKDIVGIGPFLERKLHSLGIYTFRQVGNFTKEDIGKVNEIIEFFPGRIERDDWVGQSQAFYSRKYGNRPTE